MEDKIFIEKDLKRTIIMLVCTVGLIFLGMVFRVIDIPLPNLPSFVQLQLSALPSLIGAIAYGPFVGAFIVVAKEFFYFWLSGCTLYSLVEPLVLDFVFTVVASVIYHEIRGGVIKKKNRNGDVHKKIVTRRKRIMIAGSVATVFVLVIGVLFITYGSLPLLIGKTDLTEQTVLFEYSKAFSGIDSILKGVLMINAPVLILEYMISTVLTALVYKPLSSFMHGRNVS